jgi:hypothetical protein
MSSSPPPTPYPRTYLSLAGQRSAHADEESFVAAVLHDPDPSMSYPRSGGNYARWAACARVHACEHRVKALKVAGLAHRVAPGMHATAADMYERWS